MAGRPGRVREWVRRYLAAELTGLAVALAAALLVMVWWPQQYALIAVAASLGETVGFYVGFLATRWVREPIAGPPHRRLAILLAACVVEFGPAEIADTVLVRPLAMFLGSLGTGNPIVGVLIGKLVADVIFYALAITSYEVAVRRLLTRLRPAVPAAEPDLPPAPELIMDLTRVEVAYSAFTAAFPNAAVHFAMKCNPDPPLLTHLAGLGSRFEVASAAELTTLIELGVDPAEVIFSNPVKPWWHVRDAHAAGVRRFGADSDAELAKLATYARGCAVLIRLGVAPQLSEVPSEGKFGVCAAEVERLLRAAVAAGLRPYGIAFHVGSQMLDPTAWRAPIATVARILGRLEPDGITVTALDIGGGFPADYGDPMPPIAAYAEVVREGLTAMPYPLELITEPGRGLVAEAGTLAATVIGLAVRDDHRWLHLDVGAFNGGMEALETRHQLVLPMSDDRGGELVPWHVTGPSCDSQDTLRFDAPLSVDLQVGDRVWLHTAGAYTTAYASAFNGFAVPSTRCVTAGRSVVPGGLGLVVA